MALTREDLRDDGDDEGDQADDESGTQSKVRSGVYPDSFAKMVRYREAKRVQKCPVPVQPSRSNYLARQFSSVNTPGRRRLTMVPRPEHPCAS
jgi:hypothetical protein